MFDHVSVGVSDIKKSGTFYDAVLKPLGYTRLSNGEGALGYGEKNSGLWLIATKKPVKADTESGLHFCVDAFHAAALKSGGADNGKPGVRADYGPKYYAAFVVDPDGYRIEAYCGK
jgi:catechol 2,3-dioxygenase-like lactoylglutathione lyase family enzyme